MYFLESQESKSLMIYQNDQEESFLSQEEITKSFLEDLPKIKEIFENIIKHERNYKRLFTELRQINFFRPDLIFDHINYICEDHITNEELKKFMINFGYEVKLKEIDQAFNRICGNHRLDKIKFCKFFKYEIN